jgi:hypothetical protein
MIKTLRLKLKLNNFFEIVGIKISTFPNKEIMLDENIYYSIDHLNPNFAYILKWSKCFIFMMRDICILSILKLIK